MLRIQSTPGMQNSKASEVLHLQLRVQRPGLLLRGPEGFGTRVSIIAQPSFKAHPSWLLQMGKAVRVDGGLAMVSSRPALALAF